MLKNSYVMHGLVVSLLLLPVVAPAAETVVFTQTGCQFIEPEGVDHGFKTASADDCRAINDRSGGQRLNSSEIMHLKVGDYIFRVKNRNVPYELGFWLRGYGLSRLTLPSVSGGGILTGSSRDYAITLKKGEYRYSCPLNPTPDYTLVVE